MKTNDSKLDLDLDLPDGRHFVSEAPRMRLEELFALTEVYALEAMKDPQFWEKRLKDKNMKEFTM